MADARITQIRVEELVTVHSANVAYFPEGTNNGGTNETQAISLINSWGGSRIEVASSDISSTSFDWGLYDVLLVQHASTGSSGSTTTAADLKRINEDYGIPLYLTIGGAGDSSGITASYTPELWGAHETAPNVSGGVEVVIASSSTHPIVSALSTGIREISSSALYTMPLRSTSLFVGQQLGIQTSTIHANFSTAGDPALIAVMTGSTYLSTGALRTGGRIAGVAPWYDEPWNSSGEAFFGAVMDWLIGEGPLPPDLTVVPASTSAALIGGGYRHPNSTDITHGWRRYQVDISTGVFSTAVFYDSGWSTNLGNGFVDLLIANTTGYKARVADRGIDLSTGRWSAVVSFDTLVPTTGPFALSAGILLEWLDSTGGVISNSEHLSTSTGYVSTVTEALVPPALTATLRVTPIKRGVNSGRGRVKWALVEPGELCVGYHPSPYSS